MPILYTRSWQKGEKPMTRLAFRRRLIENLSEPIRSSVSRGARSKGHTPSRMPPACTPLPSERNRRDCVVCSDRQGGTRHLTHYQCGTCPDNPALCVDTCSKPTTPSGGIAPDSFHSLRYNATSPLPLLTLCDYLTSYYIYFICTYRLCLYVCPVVQSP